MTRSDWATLCDARLEASGINNFNALEICDVGRKCSGITLSAPPLELLSNAVKVGWKPSDVADLIDDSPWKRQLGLGRYNSFTHIDVRGMIGRPSPARWGTNG